MGLKPTKRGARERVRECEMKTKEERSEWESSQHHRDPLVHSEYSGKTQYSRIKNSAQVQAKHSPQAHFHLLKITHTQSHTSDTHTLFHLSTGAQSGTASPGVGLEPSTPRMRSSDIAPRPCFQSGSRNTSKETQRGSARGESRGEREDGRKSLDGGMEKQERCTHRRPSLGLDWKRSSGRNWSLFLFSRLRREKKKKRKGNTSHVKKASHCKNHLSMNRKGQTHTLVDQRDSCCCVD